MQSNKLCSYLTIFDGIIDYNTGSTMYKLHLLLILDNPFKCIIHIASMSNYLSFFKLILLMCYIAWYLLLNFKLRTKLHRDADSI